MNESTQESDSLNLNPNPASQETIKPQTPLQKEVASFDKLQSQLSQVLDRNEELKNHLTEVTSRWQEDRSSMDSLRKEFEGFKSQSNRKQSPFEQFSTEDLELARIKFMDPVNEGRDMGRALEIEREIRKRDREDLLSEIDKRTSSHRESFEAQNQRDLSLLQAAALLGPDQPYVDASTRMMKQTPQAKFAETVYQQLEKKYPAVAEKFPPLKGLAYVWADLLWKARHQTPSEQGSVNQSDKDTAELRASRQSQNLNAASDSSAGDRNAYKEALAAKDIDRILGAIPSIASMDKRLSEREGSLLKEFQNGSRNCTYLPQCQ